MSALALQLLASLVLSPAPSSTIYVDVNNPNCPGTGTAADPFCRIQSGIEAAIDGDVIEVAPGVYLEPQTHGPIDFLGKAVTVESRDGAGSTEIRTGYGVGFLFQRREGLDSQLIGFTIDGEDRGSSVGVRCSGVARPWLRRNQFRRLDKGVHCSPLAGIRSWGNFYLDCLGHGIHLEHDGDLELSGGRVANCTIGIEAFRSVVEITGCSLRRCSSKTLVVSGEAEVRDCEFLNANPVSFFDAQVTITNCSFQNSILDCLFGAVTIDRCSFRLGRSHSILARQTHVTMTNSVISLTGSVGVDGGLETESSTLLLSHNTYWGNRGDGSVIGGRDSIIDSRNDIYWNNDASPISVSNSSVTLEYCDFEGGFTGLGNVDVDPQWVNAYAEDFRLLPTSPLIDRGDPAFSSTGLDFAGGLRVQDGDLDAGLRSDIGALEFAHVHLDVRGVLAPDATVTVHSSGTAGLATYLMIGTVTDPVLVPKLGAIYPSTSVGPWRILPWASLPSQVAFTIPPSLSIPQNFVVQQFALSGSAGNGSNPVVLEVQ